MNVLNSNRMRLALIGVVAVTVFGARDRAIADIVICDPMPVDEAINSPNTSNVQGCSFLHDGLKLYFSASRDPANSDAREIWVIERESTDAPWGEAVNLGPNINGPDGMEIEPTISPDDLELYFWRSDSGAWRSTRASTDEHWGPATPYTGIYPDDFSPDGLTKYTSGSWYGGYGGDDILMVTRATTDEDWGEPVNLGPNVNVTNSRDQFSASISNDGLALFFNTWSPYRIWMSVRSTTEDDWGPAVQLGPDVNGYGWVVFPEISPDSSTLYFDSGSRDGFSERFWQVSIKPFVDFTEDGMVDIDDLLAMIEYWGTDHSFYDIGPMAWGDGVVDDADLEVLMSYYGQAVDYTGVTVLDVKPPYNPQPANGWTIDFENALPISWTPGDTVTVHDLYFGTDRTAVENAHILDTSGVYRGEQTGNSYMPPEGVQAGQTYYWRVDEVRSEDIATKGEIWSFTIVDYIIVDDFESYDAGKQIWFTWHDGLGYGIPGTAGSFAGNGTGAAVGDVTTESYTEQTIVHGGGQSMPLRYDNDGTFDEWETTGLAFYAEAQRTWEEPQDWTRMEVETLVLWFHGAPNNSVEPMYVSLEDDAGKSDDVMYSDSAAITAAEWQQWSINLSEFVGLDLTAIKQISIRVGDKENTEPAGSGILYIDDIELHPPTTP